MHYVTLVYCMQATSFCHMHYTDTTWSHAAYHSSCTVIWIIIACSLTQLLHCIVFHEFVLCLSYLYFPIIYHTRDTRDWYMGREAHYTILWLIKVKLSLNIGEISPNPGVSSWHGEQTKSRPWTPWTVVPVLDPGHAAGPGLSLCTYFVHNFIGYSRTFFTFSI